MKNSLLIILLLYTATSAAQISGKITSKSGEAVSFASITITETHTGTSSNQEGEYYLPLKEKGQYKIVFRSLGYKTKESEVTVNQLPFELNVVMEPVEYLLDEVVISSKKDQADAIIRNAIESREENAQKTGEYEADFYSRGILYINDVPEEILGQEIGTFGGVLDSTRSGILYLSETVS